MIQGFQIKQKRPQSGTVLYLLSIVAGAAGFEPTIPGPKPGALPLGHAPLVIGAWQLSRIREQFTSDLCKSMSSRASAVYCL